VQKEQLEKYFRETQVPEFAEAQKKAQEMATQLGVVLGSLKSYTETPGGSAPQPFYMRSAVGGAAADGGVPLPSGEQEILMNVTLTYEVK